MFYMRVYRSYYVGREMISGEDIFDTKTRGRNQPVFMYTHKVTCPTAKAPSLRPSVD
jgi:hypothetical protein